MWEEEECGEREPEGERRVDVIGEKEVKEPFPKAPKTDSLLFDELQRAVVRIPSSNLG